MPRWTLLLFCAAYVIPGFVSRGPWRNADITAFGYMASLAQGHSAWLDPRIGGLSANAPLLPYWVGAVAIRLTSPWLEPAFAARIPFALLLAATLALTWYTTFHLARTAAAQPLRFAFGGEASPVDYARAVADGALLALIATLGLLQLGHETTPELVQLASVALFAYGLARAADGVVAPRLALLLSLPALTASGGPAVALWLACGAVPVLAGSSSRASTRRLIPTIVASGALAAFLGWLLDAWAIRLDPPRSAADGLIVARQIAWFTWPAWPVAAWTIWQWRRQLLGHHIVVPLLCVAVAVFSSIAMGGLDRALMLGLPGLAVLAAFALPTLQRSTAAAIDWFSVFFFSACAIAIWVVYLSMHTGIPARPSANVQRLAPGFVASFSLIALLLAGLATLAWFGLVAWRSGRNRHPLWKSMVLPAGGVALCWMLLMTLMLPILDYARSYRPLIARLATHLPHSGCVAMPNAPRGLIAAVEQLGGFRVDARASPDETNCNHLLLQQRRGTVAADPPGWQPVARELRPTDRNEVTTVYRRRPASTPAEH